MNSITGLFFVVILFALCIFSLIKSKTWLNLKTEKEYKGFLTFVGVMFILMVSISTFLYVKLNPELFEERNITITKNKEFNDIYKNNFTDFIIKDNDNYSSSSSLEFTNKSSSSSSLSSIS